MLSESQQAALQRLLDKDEIRDAMSRYARGVDRGDWDLVRSAYHPDAHDNHSDYSGGVDGFIEWLEKRFTGVDNSMHFLGNSLIEFAGPDLALVETYYVSRRLRSFTDEERHMAGPNDAMARESWGRYVDRFERRNGEWRVAHRTVVSEAASSSIAYGGKAPVPGSKGRRDALDRVFEARNEIFQKG